MGELSRTGAPACPGYTHAKEGHLDRVLRDRPWVLLPGSWLGVWETRWGNHLPCLQKSCTVTIGFLLFLQFMDGGGLGGFGVIVEVIIIN